jgi:hypothetical protein
MLPTRPLEAQSGLHIRPLALSPSRPKKSSVPCRVQTPRPHRGQTVALGQFFGLSPPERRCQAWDGSRQGRILLSPACRLTTVGWTGVTIRLTGSSRIYPYSLSQPNYSFLLPIGASGASSLDSLAPCSLPQLCDSYALTLRSKRRFVARLACPLLAASTLRLLRSYP